MGGLVGGVRGKVSNCYTGGKIEVSENTLKERVVSKKLTDLVGLKGTPAKVVQGDNSWDKNPATFVYLGGIGGSGFSSTFKNFGESQDGNPNFENCYTYMTFPAMRGTITAISLIGSVADRYGQADSMTITNCYYLDSSAKIDFTQLPKFYASGKRSLTDLLGEDSDLAKTNRDNMLKGKLDYLGQYTWDSAKTNIYHINGLTPLTYEQMSNQIGKDKFIQTQTESPAAYYKTFLDALNRNGGKAFGWVTNEESGSSIHGKYSFPGSDAALQGQDYPFPTVLRGTDSTGAKEVNLHYGAWPKVGMLWSEGIVSLCAVLRGHEGTETESVQCTRGDRGGTADLYLQPRGRGQGKGCPNHSRAQQGRLCGHADGRRDRRDRGDCEVRQLHRPPDGHGHG